MSFRKIFLVITLMLNIFCKLNAQVNLPTGSAEFSLPILNWKDDKSRLKAVVALSYSSGNGMKVDNVASNAGQGWNFIGGGVITRMQVGEPDDQIAYPGTFPSNNDQDITKYPAGYLYKSKDPAAGCPKALSRYPTYGAQNVLYAQHNVTAEDKQLDYFTFQFNGQSGVFILDTAGGDHGISLRDSRIKIAFQRDPTMANSQGIRTTITSFTITDVDGLIYKFSQHELTKILKVSFSDPTGMHVITQPNIVNTGVYYQSAFDLGPTAAPWNTTSTNKQLANPFIITSWYLSEIDDPFTARKVVFNYSSPITLTNDAGADITYNMSTKQYAIVSYKKSKTQSLDLLSISYPDSTYVILNYALQTRVDFPGEKAITSIDVKYKSRYLSKYVLNTSYFILNRYGTPNSTFEKSAARLCLRSVQKIGVDLKEDTPPYIFDYYTGSNNLDDYVPPPFFFAKDIWGFYNGNNSLQFTSTLAGSLPVTLNQTYATLDNNSAKGLCFLNQNITYPGINYNAKPNYAQNGLLKQIVYPTGGSLTYTYAQNTGLFIGGSTVNNMGGVHVSQTSSTDGGYSNGCANAITTKYDYVVNGSGSASSLWGVEQPVNTMTNNNYYQDEQPRIKWSFPLNFSCKWSYMYPGIVSQDEAVGLTWWQNTMAALSPYLSVLSFISEVMDVINVISDATPLAVVAIVIDIIASVINLVFGCSQTVSTTPDTMFYNFDLNSGSPLPAQFKRVEITESPGTNGKTVQQFTHGDATVGGNEYYPLWSPGSNATFSQKQRFAPWAYGLPYLTTVYDNAGYKVKETENDYDFNNAQELIKHIATSELCFAHAYNYPTSCKCLVINNHSQRGDSWGTIAQYDATYYAPGDPSNIDILVDVYNYYTGRVNLSKTLERIYKPLDVTNFVQTETDYSYNTGDTCSGSIFNYEINQITTYSSNGDIKFKNIYYPYNFPANSFLLSLTNKNIVTVPISTTTSVSKSGVVSYLGEKVTEFAGLSNGDFKPNRILEQRFQNPVTSFTRYSGPSTTNYSLYKIPQTFTYDANGNLIGLKDEGSRLVMNVYGYLDKYIVGVAINSDASTDKICYTSFEDGTYGGWTPTGTPANNPVCITGTNSFNLSGLSISTPLAKTKIYTLSLWSTSLPSVSAGCTLTKTGPTYNSFTYYEYDVAASTATVTITGSTTIDELRLYPKTARFKTTTYDPLIGKTSECDENNRITYYTYDNLGRLQFIKDESANIVKMYEYNNVSPAKQVGCPGTYSNKAISETYTRSNCTGNTVGTNYTFTVAAGLYTSAFSQFDADFQAEIYLLTNGQTTANTNASCIPIYYNTLKSQTYTRDNCNLGYKGVALTYNVPVGTYSSIISQADADQKASDDVVANAWAYINSPYNSSCVIDTAADWEYDPTLPEQCQKQGSPASNTGSQMVQPKDQNPNSPTYNQTKNVATGVNTTACPVGFYIQPATKWSADVQSNIASGTNVSINATCYQEGTFTFTSPTKVGYLGSDVGGAPSNTFIPTATRSATVTESGRTWAVTVDTVGGVYIKLTSGTKPPSGTSGSSLIYLAFSYTL